MAKRYYNLEKETKALLKKWEARNGVLPSMQGIHNVNDYILRKKGLGQLVGGIGKRAASFNATNKQYLTIPSNSSLGIATNLTMAAWFMTTATGQQWFINKVITNGQYTYALGMIGDKLWLYLSQDGTATQIKDYRSSASFNTGVPVFVCGTFDNGTTRLFANGAELTGSALNKNTNYAITTIKIGTSPLGVGWDGTTSYSSGTTGPNFLLSRTLTATEITYLYNSGLGRSYLEILAYQPSLLTNMVSYWPLNESSGTRFDYHGSNNLTAINNPLSTSGVVEELF